MKLLRRQFLHLAAGAAALPAVSLLASFEAALAQPFPGKTVRLVIPFPVGGSTDTNARIISQRLTERWAQSVIVDPRPGGGTIIGTEHVVKSKPDGHTLLLTSPALTVNPALHAKLPYDTLTDLVPVTIVSISPMTIVSHPSLPVNSIKELIALAMTKPGQLNYGNSDPSAMFTGQLFNVLAKVDIQSIPYKGAGPLMIDLIGGHVPLGIAAVSSVQAAVRSGQVRLLGVGSLAPSPTFPDALPIAKDVPGFEAVAWFGLFAPRGTPKEIVARIQKDVAEVVHTPDITQRLLDVGAEPGGQSSAEFDARIRAEIDQWIKIGRTVGIKPQ
jgi:tripartite-type tricarboxylate transporter receptor subunit TctC